MALFKSGNPALNENIFVIAGKAAKDNRVMTLQGTVNKTALLMMIVVFTSFYTWNLFMTTLDVARINPYVFTGIIGSLVLSVVIIIRKKWAPFLSPLHAIMQGLFLGALSAMYEYLIPGIVMQALLLTFGILSALLIVYKLRILKPTENLKLFVVAGTAGLALYYVANLALSFAGIRLPFIHENSVWGILFNVFAIVMASLNLVVDFDFIEHGVDSRAPKYMEWYGAFGLMITIIWLYIEILSLLAKTKQKESG
ncbi:MAG: Bax inhibitor-1/YccA family protein [Bacteroidales bacterium]